MTRVIERQYNADRYFGKKKATLKNELQTAEARIEVLDNIDDLKEMNAQLSESLKKVITTETQADEKLWADVEKDDHHLGAGLNGRWF